MKKTPKFMVATNPMVDSKPQYILHTGSPEVLIRVVLLDDITEEQKKDVRLIVPEGKMNSVPGTRYVLYFEKFFEQSEENSKKLVGLMNRAKDWWVAYLKNKNLRTDIMDEKEIRELIKKADKRAEDVEGQLIHYKKEMGQEIEELRERIDMLNRQLEDLE
jgi:hypothetical protein